MRAGAAAHDRTVYVLTAKYVSSAEELLSTSASGKERGFNSGTKENELLDQGAFRKFILCFFIKWKIKLKAHKAAAFAY